MRNKASASLCHLHHDVCEKCLMLRYFFNYISSCALVQTTAGPKLYHFLLFTFNVVLYLPIFPRMLPAIILRVAVVMYKQN